MTTTETASDTTVTPPSDASITETFRALESQRSAAGLDAQPDMSTTKALGLSMTVQVYERSVMSATGGPTSEPAVTVIADLLTDLRHLVAAIPGADFEQLLRQSEMQFVAEGGD